MNKKNKNELDCTMPGSRVRDGHAATVLSIVGAQRMVPVTSAGKRFYMKGPFGWREVSAAICDGVTDPAAIAVRVTNATYNPAVSINVAQCDDDVSRRTYLALIGGACHEAWHRLYSQQGPLQVETIRAALKPLRGTQINWSKRKRLFMDLQNVFEDVAIERIGNAEFPGAHTKLCDLADFIVRMETEGRTAAGNPPITVANAVFVCLRDMGLGYNTFTIRENLAVVKAECPTGYAMVANGMLTDILRRSIPDVSTPAAIARAKKALLDGSSLTLALEALVLLEGVASGEIEPPKPPQGEGGKPMKGPKAPKGAKPDKAPKGDKPEKGDKGDKPETSDKPEKGDGDGEPNEPGDDGEPSDGGDEPGEGDQPGEGEPGDDGDGSGDSDEDANGDSDGDSDGDGEPSDGDGEPSDGDPSDGDSDGGDPAEGGDSDGDSDGEPGEPGDTTNTKDGKGSSNGAGGGEGADAATAGDFLDEAENGSGTLDANSALEQGVASENAQEAGTRESSPYRPYSTSCDEIVKVRPNPSNANSFANIAREVRKGTSYLKTRLATVFRALENSGTEHGVRVGRKVSDRMLVNTYCELRGGDKPTRPYRVTAPVIDMSVASAVVIDESSSMSDKLRQTTAIVYTLLDALDCIGAKSMALGFRSKHARMSYTIEDMPTDCHRTSAMYYDLFKDWSERFSTVAPRLKEIRAQGGTPMADGIEFALNELSKRPEGYRVLFVVTDGQPDGGHDRVIRSQMKRAHDAGILVVGVGLGYGSEHVKTTFDDSVYHTKLDELPKELCAKLEHLVRTRHAAAKRGRAVREA